MLRGQRELEVALQLALARVELALDLLGHDLAGPAVLDRLLHVPVARGSVLHALQELDHVAPKALVKRAVSQFQRPGRPARERFRDTI
jgi:hypothetical protein